MLQNGPESKTEKLLEAYVKSKIQKEGPEYLSKLEMNDLGSRAKIEVGSAIKVKVELIVDSGASCNVINYMLWEHLKLRSTKCKCFLTIEKFTLMAVISRR